MFRKYYRYGWLLILISTASSLSIDASHDLGTPSVTFVGTNEVIVPFTLSAPDVYKLRPIPGAIQENVILHKLGPTGMTTNVYHFQPGFTTNLLPKGIYNLYLYGSGSLNYHVNPQVRKGTGLFNYLFVPVNAGLSSTNGATPVI